MTTPVRVSMEDMGVEIGSGTRVAAGLGISVVGRDGRRRAVEGWMWRRRVTVHHGLASPSLLGSGSRARCSGQHPTFPDSTSAAQPHSCA